MLMNVNIAHLLASITAKIQKVATSVLVLLVLFLILMEPHVEILMNVQLVSTYANILVLILKAAIHVLVLKDTSKSEMTVKVDIFPSIV